MVEYVVYDQKSSSATKYIKWFIMGFLLLVCVLLPLYAHELRYQVGSVIKKVLFIIGSFATIIGGFMLIIGLMSVLSGRLNVKSFIVGAMLLYIGIWLIGITTGGFPESFSDMGGGPANDPGYH